MKKSFYRWQCIGFVFAVLFGTLLHFTYDWSNQSSIVGLFSAVNESTWEHMKILFFPMLIFAVVEYSVFREQRNFWCIKLLGILDGVVMIPILYYTYNGAIGQSPDWLNITFFVISAGMAYLLEAYLVKRDFNCRLSQRFAIFLIVLLGVIFISFTFYPPKIPLFIDPTTGTYGIMS